MQRCAKLVRSHIRCQLMIEAQPQKLEPVLRDTHKKRKSVYSSIGSCWTNLPSALTWSSRRRKSDRKTDQMVELDDFPSPSCTHTETNGLTYHAQKVGLQRPREQWRRQVPQVLLQQAGDCVEVVKLAALEQVDVPFSVEALFQLPDHVGTPGQAEDAFLVLGVLQAEVRTSTRGGWRLKRNTVGSPWLRGTRRSGTRSRAARGPDGFARSRPLP